MSSGEKINTSEHRAVLHAALRLPANAKSVYVDGENIVPIFITNSTAHSSSRQLLDGTRGHYRQTDYRLGSHRYRRLDLGPRGNTGAAALLAKHPRSTVSNSDDADLTQTFSASTPRPPFQHCQQIVPHTRNLLNAYAARAWYRDAGLPDSGIYRHFCAISADVAAAKTSASPRQSLHVRLGRRPLFRLVSIGLPLMVAVGEKRSANATGARDGYPLLRNAIPPQHSRPDGAHRRLVQQLPTFRRPNCCPMQPQHAPLYPGSTSSIWKASANSVLRMASRFCTTGGVVFGDESAANMPTSASHQGTRLIPSSFIIPMTTVWQPPPTPLYRCQCLRPS